MPDSDMGQKACEIAALPGNGQAEEGLFSADFKKICICKGIYGDRNRGYSVFAG